MLGSATLQDLNAQHAADGAHLPLAETNGAHGWEYRARTEASLEGAARGGQETASLRALQETLQTIELQSQRQTELLASSMLQQAERVGKGERALQQLLEQQAAQAKRGGGGGGGGPEWDAVQEKLAAQAAHTARQPLPRPVGFFPVLQYSSSRACPRWLERSNMGAMFAPHAF